MLAITRQEVTPEILELFDLSKPTMPRAFNVLEGITTGQIVVDDLVYPHWAVVRDATYGTLYFGGQVSPSSIPSIFDHFFQFGDIGIGCWLIDPLNEMLPANPDYNGFTLYFKERSTDIFMETFFQQLPSGFTLNARDENLLKRSFDYASTLASFGSIENALRYTLGVSVIHDDLLISEAATGAATHGLLEVGVSTHEEFRRKGFATAACAKLITTCEAQGYSTWWDCAKQNTPSARLARKLGYCNEQEYRYVWWGKR
jgi:RimJ/RimL family protein N-acetyltransferase